MICKLMIALVTTVFIGTIALAEGRIPRKAKKELTAEQKNKKAAKKQARLTKLQNDFPEEMAKYNKLLAEGKKTEARAQMKEIHKKRTLAHLGELAEKYPEKVAALIKLMEDSSEEGQQVFRRKYKALKKQIRADQKQGKESSYKGKTN